MHVSARKSHGIKMCGHHSRPTPYRPVEQDHEDAKCWNADELLLEEERLETERVSRDEEESDMALATLAQV